jgi:hypothetical protein
MKDAAGAVLSNVPQFDFFLTGFL